MKFSCVLCVLLLLFVKSDIRFWFLLCNSLLSTEMLKFKINASHLMLYFDEDANLATLNLVYDECDDADEGRGFNLPFKVFEVSRLTIVNQMYTIGLTFCKCKFVTPRLVRI